MQFLLLDVAEIDLGNIAKTLQPYLLKFFWAVAILIIGLFLVKILDSAFRKFLKHTKFDETAQYFCHSAARITAKIFVFVMAFSAAGVDIGPLIAGIGVAGFVVGFALKDTLSNLAAGIMLLIYRPFRKGDKIEILGGRIKGTVQAIDVPATIIVSENQEVIIVPNSKVWGEAILNYSRDPKTEGQ